MLFSFVYRIFVSITESLKLLREIRQSQIAQDSVLAELVVLVSPLPATEILFDVEIEGKIQEGVETFTMTNSQVATITAKIVGKGGAPATVDGALTWATSDETLATVVVQADPPDGTVAKLTPTGPLTDPAGEGVTVTCTGDADLGAGVKPIFGKLSIPITKGNAVGIELTLGDVTEQ